MNQSFLYYDVDETNHYFNQLIPLLESYANMQKRDIYVLNIPKSDLSSEIYEKEGCFMLLSPGYKVALINGYADEGAFNDYKEDVQEVISYLFSKYEYRSELGRYKDWSVPILISCDNFDINALDSFWNDLKLEKEQEIKNANLLIALCTGSINEISRVKAGLPQNLLEKVQQKIQLFDADQTRFIYKEPEKKIIKIQGLSGTGKTELLLHKLKELYQSPQKYKIFVTCHNRILADSLHKRIPSFFDFLKVSQQIEWGERLWCANAWGRQNFSDSGLYSYICSFYKIPYQPFSYYTNFDDVCKTAVKAISTLQKNPDFEYAFDYIIVDECQDFKESFFQLCDLVTSQKIYVAGDVFQSIFSEQNLKDYEADTFLSRCYRTDARTLMFAHALGLGLFEKTRFRWLRKEDWEACGYNYEDLGENIKLSRDSVRQYLGEELYDCMQIVDWNDTSNLLDRITDCIKSIQQEFSNVTVNDICIIMLDEDDSSYTLVNLLESIIYDRFGWFVNKAYETKQGTRDTLLISNRNNVKGLEYPFVLCVTKGLRDSYAYRNVIYTMMTRSFLRTYLIIPNKKEMGMTDEILRGYEEIMKHRAMTIRKATSEEVAQIGARFNDAKNKRPIADILYPLIERLDITEEEAKKLMKAATSIDIKGASDSEIIYKLMKLREAIS